MRGQAIVIVDSDTVYKLMILYMLNKLDCQLTGAQLSQFFVSKNYIRDNDITKYFNIQSILTSLVESKFLEKVVIRNTSYYSITPAGYETLAYFKSQIPKGALGDIDEFISENAFELKNEVGTQADYYKHTSGDYIAHLQVMEGKTLLYEINISLPSEEEARHVCDNWKISSEEIYSYVMKTLLS